MYECGVPHTGKPDDVVLSAIGHSFPDEEDTLMFGFLHGLRPGNSTHVMLAPGGCNTTVVQNVIVPDFLPPSFTGLARSGALTPADIAANTSLTVRPFSCTCWHRK